MGNLINKFNETEVCHKNPDPTRRLKNCPLEPECCMHKTECGCRGIIMSHASLGEIGNTVLSKDKTFYFFRQFCENIFCLKTPLTGTPLRGLWVQ